MIPFNRFDPEPFRRAELTAQALDDLASRARREAHRLILVGRTDLAFQHHGYAAEYEKKARLIWQELALERKVAA